MLEATGDGYHKTFYNSKDVSCPPHPGGSDSKDFACNAGDTGYVSSIPGLGDSLEKEIAAHSTIFAWEVPWTEEPDGLQSMRLQCIEHSLVTNTVNTQDYLIQNNRSSKDAKPCHSCTSNTFSDHTAWKKE